MTFRFWVGMWCFFFLIFIIMFELSAYVRYITRFTQESFAALIAIIFIVEAFRELFAIRNIEAEVKVPNDTNETERICFKFENFLSNKSNFCNEINSSNLLSSKEFRMFGPGKEATCKSETFNFSITLFILTFLLSYVLAKFKNTRYLPYKVYSLPNMNAI